MNWPWSELGLPGPCELTEIRRAYAQLLKVNHPEEDPEGFQRLHNAYQAACRCARQNQRAQRRADAEPAPEEPAGTRQAPEEPEREPGAEWDYGDLLKNVRMPGKAGEPGEAPDAQPEGGRQAEKEPEPPEWDYERLFAEGEEEAREARRRKLEELREKNRERYAAQEEEQRERAADEAAAWEAVMAAAQALEMLHSTGAPLREWQRFLSSPVFWNARGNLDFVFALEDFLEENPGLAPEIRRAVFEAYGFERGVGRPEYRRLYQLLGVGRKERRKIWKKNRPPLSKKRRIINFAAAAWLALLVSVGVVGVIIDASKEIVNKLFPSVSWEDQCLEWMEEDLGCAFIRPFPDKLFRYSEEDEPEDGDYVKACVYAREDRPDEYFFAYQDGERDLGQGKPGYQTNYVDRMLMTELTEFAEKWGVGLEYDSANGGYHGNLGETPGAYLFQLPLTGKERFITDLGAKLSHLKAEEWYEREPPKYEIMLCYGDVNFYSRVSTHGDFDADYARSMYENKLGPNICRLVAEESGTAAADLGVDSYVLLERGTVQLEGETFFWVSALEKPPSKTVLAHYLLSVDGKELYAMTVEMFEGEMALEDMKRGEGKPCTVEELGEHGDVLIWDYVRN